MATLTTSYQMLAQKYLGNSYGDLYVRIYAKYIEQDVANNRTKVQYQARAYFSGNYIIDRQASGSVSGTNAASVTGSLTRIDGGEVTIATTDATWVTHNNDGKKTVSASAYLNFPNWGWSATAAGTADLPTIPRQATITDAPNFHDEENPTIKYSNPAGDIVTSLEACISLDGSKDDVPYREIEIDGTSYTFELTDEERTTLRKATTGSNSRSVIFFVRTEIGGNTLYSTLKKMLTIIDGLPTLSPVAKDINEKTLNLTGDENIFVRNHSIAEVSAGAEVCKEATISSQNITCGSKTIDGAGGTIEAVDSGNIVFRVTDSRNNTVSKMLTKGFVEYINLTCDLKANAPDADGDMDFTISGKCFKGSFGRKENSVNVYYRYKVADGEYGEWVQGAAVLNDDNTYTAGISLSGLDYTKRHTFQAYAEDLIMSIESVEKTVSTIPLFDWGEKDFNFNIDVYLKKLLFKLDDGSNLDVLNKIVEISKMLDNISIKTVEREVILEANEWCAPYSYYKSFTIDESDLSNYGEPISIYATNSAAVPVPVTFGTTERRTFWVVSTTANNRVKITYLKILKNQEQEV